MYSTSNVTGETTFQLTIQHRARQVILECFSESNRFRVPMRRAASRWIARLPLRTGWVFYRFRVDGRISCGRGLGRIRTQEGELYHLAVINLVGAAA